MSAGRTLDLRRWSGSKVVDRRLNSASVCTDQWIMTRAAAKPGRQGRKIAIVLPRGYPLEAANEIAAEVRAAMEAVAVKYEEDSGRPSIYATWHPKGWAWWNGRIEVAKRDSLAVSARS